MATAHMNVKGRTSLDGSGWAAGLRKMETGTKASAGRMAASMAGMVGGLFAVSALRSATMRMVEHADAIDKMAKRMESSTDTAQKFDFAASQNGATIEMVERSFMKTAQAMEGARQGLATYVRAFEAFGISMQQIKTSTPEEIFLKIAESIEKAGGALDKAKSLQDIMGRGGRQLVPAFVSGFAATAASAPDPIDVDSIRRLAEFNDELDRLKREILPGAALAVKGLADVFLAFNAEYRKDTMTFQQPEINPATVVPVGDIPGEAGKVGAGGKLPFVKSNAGFFETLLVELSKNPLLPDAAPTSSKIRVAQDRERRRLMKEGVPVNLATGELVRDDMNMDRGVFLGSNVGQLPASQVSESAAAGAKSFIKPSLALNALQRIGAAVSQSADPIAIEKDNNVLLKRIANNTKDIARNSE
jgi:hypothetical protein